MGSFSIWHWLIVLAVVLIVFGGSGKISSIMGDVAKGIKSFKKGMTDDESAAAPAQDPFKKEEPKALDNAAPRPAAAQAPPQAQQGATAQPATPPPAAQVNKVS
jgi:sec-independent protein translocase protein TatA